LRAGTVAAVIANANRDAKAKPEPFEILDFVPWNAEFAQERRVEPILLDSAEAQSALIDSMMFPKRD